MAYKDMKTVYYVIGTLSFYIIILAVSCLVNDVSIVFDFVSATSITMLAFIFPAWFYLVAQGKFCKPQDKSPMWTGVSVFFLILGLCNFLLSMSVNIMGFISK